MASVVPSLKQVNLVANKLKARILGLKLQNAWGHMENLIEGVVVTPLKLVANEKGRLMEVQRRDDAGYPGFGQVYVTQCFANVVKAWYRHRRQVDQIAAIAGLVKLVLFDDRADSRTRDKICEIILDEQSPRLALIPPGVWHGFKAIGHSSAFLLHLNSEPFRFDEPDEERRPVNDPNMPYSWQAPWLIR